MSDLASDRFLGATKATLRPGLAAAPAAERIEYKLRSGRIAFGTELRIDFLSRLRGERMFDSVDALVDQIARDVQRTRELAG